MVTAGKALSPSPEWPAGFSYRGGLGAVPLPVSLLAPWVPGSAVAGPPCPATGRGPRTRLLLGSPRRAESWRPAAVLGALLIQHDFMPEGLANRCYQRLRDTKGAFQKPWKVGLSCWHRMGLDAKTVHWTRRPFGGKGTKCPDRTKSEAGGWPVSIPLC